MVGPADGQFGVGIKSHHLLDVYGESVNHVRRGQAVLEDEPGLVGVVRHIAFGPGHFEERWCQLVDIFAAERQVGRGAQSGLTVGPDLDTVVVGHHQIEGDLRDGIRTRPSVGDVGEVVTDHDFLVPVRTLEALVVESAADHGPRGRIGHHRPLADFLPPPSGRILGGYDDLVREQGRASHAVVR